MDFSYTPEEEQFRYEVRSWLEANVPADLQGGETRTSVSMYAGSDKRTGIKSCTQGAGLACGGRKSTADGGRQSVNR